MNIKILSMTDIIKFLTVPRLITWLPERLNFCVAPVFTTVICELFMNCGSAVDGGLH